jgi:hypothetical protein
MTDREQVIETLLTWYTAVEEGWQKFGAGSGDLGIKMMSAAWNSRSYKELRRCLILMRDTENKTYWHIRERFQAGKRTVLKCPSCGMIENVAAKHFTYRQRGGRSVTLKHKHGRDVVFFDLATIPVVNHAVRPEVVADGIRWIAREFTFEPSIPVSLLDPEEKKKAA